MSLPLDTRQEVVPEEGFIFGNRYAFTENREFELFTVDGNNLRYLKKEEFEAGEIYVMDGSITRSGQGIFPREKGNVTVCVLVQGVKTIYIKVRPEELIQFMTPEKRGPNGKPDETRVTGAVRYRAKDNLDRKVEVTRKSLGVVFELKDKARRILNQEGDKIPTLPFDGLKLGEELIVREQDSDITRGDRGNVVKLSDVKQLIKGKKTRKQMASLNMGSATKGAAGEVSKECSDGTLRGFVRDERKTPSDVDKMSIRRAAAVIQKGSIAYRENATDTEIRDVTVAAIGKVIDAPEPPPDPPVKSRRGGHER